MEVTPMGKWTNIWATEKPKREGSHLVLNTFTPNGPGQTPFHGSFILYKETKHKSYTEEVPVSREEMISLRNALDAALKEAPV
jgi:tRNA1(Val) A37 N6-methylase TrmN6